jgi:hypothetical protein
LSATILRLGSSLTIPTLTKKPRLESEKTIANQNLEKCNRRKTQFSLLSLFPRSFASSLKTKAQMCTITKIKFSTSNVFSHKYLAENFPSITIYIFTVLAALNYGESFNKTHGIGTEFPLLHHILLEKKNLPMQHWKGKYQSLPVSISSSPITICKNRRCSSEPPSEQETRVAMASEACASPSFSATTTTTTTTTQKRTQNNEFADEIFTPVLFFVSTACKKQMDIF